MIPSIIRQEAESMRALMGVRLSGVTVYTLAGLRSPMLRIVWHGFIRDAGGEAPLPAGVEMTGGSAAPDTHVILPPLDEVEIVRAAWELGAWDIRRIEHPPLPAGVDPYEPGRGLWLSSWAAEDMSAAAAEGWISWAWRPTWGSIRVGRNTDRTLEDDGSRTAALPALTIPAPRGIITDGICHDLIIRLGRDSHPNRGGKKRQDRKS